MRVGEAAPTAASSPIPDRGILLLAGKKGREGGNWKQWVASHSQVGMLPTKNSCRYIHPPAIRVCCQKKYPREILE